MTTVHVCEGGEYECAHYSVHKKSDCVKEYHDTYVEIDMEESSVKLIQAAILAGSEAEETLRQIYGASGRPQQGYKL